MARTHAAPSPDNDQALLVGASICPVCGKRIPPRYYAHRTVIHLDQVVHYTLQVKRCETPTCPRYHQPIRPEAELGVALPQQEIGLDVIAEVGHLRYRELLTVGQIHQRLLGRDVPISERSVTNLLERYEELVTLRLGEDRRLQGLLAQQGRAIVSIDGLQPDKGYEVLWVLREVLSAEVLLARSLVSTRITDLWAMLDEVRQAVPVPIVGIISDGQHTIRTAVAQALPGVPHQLCPFHYLRAATMKLTEADRHARKRS